MVLIRTEFDCGCICKWEVESEKDFLKDVWIGQKALCGKHGITQIKLLTQFRKHDFEEKKYGEPTKMKKGTCGDCGCSTWTQHVYFYTCDCLCHVLA